jgi:hypothetical protein
MVCNRLLRYWRRYRNFNRISFESFWESGHAVKSQLRTEVSIACWVVAQIVCLMYSDRWGSISGMMTTTVKLKCLLRNLSQFWFSELSSGMYYRVKWFSTIILHGSTSQKTILNIILAAVRTWNLTVPVHSDHHMKLNSLWSAFSGERAASNHHIYGQWLYFFSSIKTMKFERVWVMIILCRIQKLLRVIWSVTTHCVAHVKSLSFCLSTVGRPIIKFLLY